MELYRQSRIAPPSAHLQNRRVGSGPTMPDRLTAVVSDALGAKATYPRTMLIPNTPHKVHNIRLLAKNTYSRSRTRL